MEQNINTMHGFIPEPGFITNDPASHGNNDIDDLFQEMNNVKLNAIREAVDEINMLIKEREKLREELAMDFEKVGMKFTNFLTERKDGLASEQVIEIQRKVIELEEDKAREKINAWRDIAMLKKELREYKLALKEKEDGMAMLQSTMKI
jgi:hypothetical protein